MTSILHLISSPRKDASVSIRLGKAIVEHLQLKYPDSTVTEINLLDQLVPHLDATHLQAFFTPTEELTSVNMQSIQYSDEAISQIMNADLIVIGSPMYNFTIHSSLKAWIDQITRAGKTFRYTESGPEGLVVGKKVYLAVASGGVYSNGPFQPYDSVVPYLKNILGFLGMTDLTVYRAEGLNIPELKDGAWEQALASIDV
jgi:FMN-dependent NADH-azoreductase